MNTALEDELIPSNSCRIKGASTYRHAERPTLGIDEIEELARQVPVRYKATVYPIDSEYVVQTPKSRAGVRTIVLPEFVTEVLREHMKDYSPSAPMVCSSQRDSALAHTTPSNSQSRAPCARLAMRVCGCATCGTPDSYLPRRTVQP